MLQIKYYDSKIKSNNDTGPLYLLFVYFYINVHICV